MALSPKLELRQSQSLVMTPQLMQSIRLLQMTHVELEQFIDLEIERNPVIEREEPGTETDHAPEAPRTVEGTERDPIGSDLSANAEDISDAVDSSLENVFPDEPGRYDSIGPDLASQWKSAAGSGYAGRDQEGFDLEAVTAAPISLRDYVTEQIAFAFADPAERLIAGELADGLDENGYLNADMEEIAERLGVSVERVEAVLGVLQSFDPAGIFARSLSECIAIQLRQKDRFDPAMAALVANLELLARRDFQALKRLCGVDENDLVDMLAEIRSLDPKPGTAFSVGVADAIVPDVTVRPARDGTWEIELNPAALPRVLVNHSYYATVSQAAKGEEKEFLAECMQNANWLTRSLDQRARTILKVASEIVRQQDAFLVHGVSRLKPLNLRMVADAIGMHESTVSRVTANKYMLTPRGVFELRYFFNAGIASADGRQAHSSEAVRHEIRRLIDREEPSAILSDDDIVEALGKRGIEIARRTVAKYRESMNIPSSVQRRREKRALAAAAS